jgi:hypothetical protein
MITWTKTATGATGTGETRHCRYQFTIRPSEFFAARVNVYSRIENLATGEVIHEGTLGTTGSVAACKRMAAEQMAVGGPRLDTRIGGEA